MLGGWGVNVLDVHGRQLCTQSATEDGPTREHTYLLVLPT